MAIITNTACLRLNDLLEYKGIMPNSMEVMDPESLMHMLYVMLESKLTSISSQVSRYAGGVQGELGRYIKSPGTVRLVLNELSDVAEAILENLGKGEFNRIRVRLQDDNGPILKFVVLEYDNCLKIEEFRLFLNSLETEGETVHPDVYRLMDRFIDAGHVFLNTNS